MIEQNQKFRENLIMYRKQKGLLQKDLAESLGVSTSAVSSWEKGINFPRLDAIFNICEVLDITIGDLLGISAKQYTPEEQDLINAYRQNPAMRPAVRRLLGLE